MIDPFGFFLPARTTVWQMVPRRVLCSQPEYNPELACWPAANYYRHSVILCQRFLLSLYNIHPENACQKRITAGKENNFVVYLSLDKSRFS